MGHFFSFTFLALFETGLKQKLQVCQTKYILDTFSFTVHFLRLVSNKSFRFVNLNYIWDTFFLSLFWHFLRLVLNKSFRFVKLNIFGTLFSFTVLALFETGLKQKLQVCETKYILETFSFTVLCTFWDWSQENAIPRLCW